MKYNYKNKNCIVTGASGFIGQALTDALIKNGAMVFVIDNFSFGSVKESINPEAKIFQGDVRNYSSFSELPKLKYDYLFHFAAPSSIILFNKDPYECVDITINGFLNAARFSIDNQIRLVYPSTGSLYSGAKSPHSENAQLSLENLNSYARAKLSLELIHESLKELNAIGLRIFAGYGPQERHKGEFSSVIYSFCKEILEGRRPVIFGDGTQKRDFIYIDDLAEAIIVLAENGRESVINIGSGKSFAFNEIIEIINSRLKTSIKPVYVEKPVSYLEETLADSTILSNYYLPKTSLVSGVQTILNSL